MGKDIAKSIEGVKGIPTEAKPKGIKEANGLRFVDLSLECKYT